jgi:hypothetical protein
MAEQNENKDSMRPSGGSSTGGSATTGSGSSPKPSGTSGTTSGASGTQAGLGTAGSTGTSGSTSNKASGTTDDLASNVGGVLRGDTGAAKGILSQVKESTSNVAGGAIDQVKEKATTKIDEQKATLASGLGSVAQTIRQVGETVKGSEAPEGVATLTAQYSDTLARQVEQFSHYLEKNNVSDLLREVERFARRNPAYFIGGAFALGLLGARFLKSSNPNQALMRYEGNESGGGSTGGRNNRGGDGGRNSGSNRSGTTDREIFHHHDETTGSGEGVRPV